MGGEEEAATGADDGVASDCEAVNINIQANGLVTGIEKDHQITYGNSAGSLGDGSHAYRSGNTSGSSGEGFRTYKRRKRGQAALDGKVSGNTATEIEEKSTQELLDILANKDAGHRASFVEAMPLHAVMNASYDCSVKQRRNIVLQQICESLDDEAGLAKCIRDALVLCPESGCTSFVKESIHSCEDGRKSTSLSGPGHLQFQNDARYIENSMLNESINDTNYRTVTELCQQTFLDVVMCEKFSILCNLLLENFQGTRMDKLFDIGRINSRMKEGAYESSPVFFLSDIQQVWNRLQKVGSDIVALANNLSEKSRAAFKEEVGGVLHGSSHDGVLDFVTQESDMPSKVEQTEAYVTYRSCTCQCCNGKKDGRDCLVCDSCEAMYHVSCIEPAVQEIPGRSWHCSSCTRKGIQHPHDNCVICETINASRSFSTMDGIDQLTNGEASVELEESSNGLMEDDLQLSVEGKEMRHCHVCRTDIQGHEKLKVCDHGLCPHKYYHARCLTTKQLNSYGPRWYCPSCLCRVCLTDRDDEKIVLCDACDQAYHVYCMQPPRMTIPRGKWFCKSCNEDIRRIRRAKRKYENLRNTWGKNPEQGKASHDGRLGGKGEKEEPLHKSVGVDMLLTAAKTLNNEENLAAMDRKN